MQPLHVICSLESCEPQEFGRASLIKVGNELRMVVNTTDQLEFDHDGSSVQALDFGVNPVNVILSVNEDGEFVSANRLWELPDSLTSTQSSFVLAN